MKLEEIPQIEDRDITKALASLRLLNGKGLDNVQIGFLFAKAAFGFALERQANEPWVQRQRTTYDWDARKPLDNIIYEPCYEPDAQSDLSLNEAFRPLIDAIGSFAKEDAGKKERMLSGAYQLAIRAFAN